MAKICGLPFNLADPQEAAEALEYLARNLRSGLRVYGGKPVWDAANNARHLRQLGHSLLREVPVIKEEAHG